MKQLLVFVLIVVGLFSCTDEKKSATTMNAEELKAKHGIVLPDLEYNGDEIATAPPNGKGGAKKKASVITLSVFLDGLTLTESGGVLTTNISTNAEWGGVQKFIDITTNDGASSVCNWNWSNVTAPASQTCSSNGTGNYRS